jgi:hypothetical protein
MRSYVEVAGSAKIKIEDHTASVTFSRVYYGGMWRGRPSLVIPIAAREHGEVLRSHTLWQNRWFADVVKLSLSDRAARFLAAFALFDRFAYRFDVDLGMAVEKLYIPRIPGGCIYADVGLPMKIWRAAYAAYNDMQDLERWAPKRFRKRIRYVEIVLKKLTDWF